MWSFQCFNLLKPIYLPDLLFCKLYQMFHVFECSLKPFRQPVVSQSFSTMWKLTCLRLVSQWVLMQLLLFLSVTILKFSSPKTTVRCFNEHWNMFFFFFAAIIPPVYAEHLSPIEKWTWLTLWETNHLKEALSLFNLSFVFYWHEQNLVATWKKGNTLENLTSYSMFLKIVKTNVLCFL